MSWEEGGSTDAFVCLRPSGLPTQPHGPAGSLGLIGQWSEAGLCSYQGGYDTPLPPNPPPPQFLNIPRAWGSDLNSPRPPAPGVERAEQVG